MIMVVTAERVKQERYLHAGRPGMTKARTTDAEAWCKVRVTGK